MRDHHGTVLVSLMISSRRLQSSEPVDVVSEGYASAPESPGGYESAASALSDHRAASLRVRRWGQGTSSRRCGYGQAKWVISTVRQILTVGFGVRARRGSRRGTAAKPSGHRSSVLGARGPFGTAGAASLCLHDRVRMLASCTLTLQTAVVCAEQAELSASESERARLADALAASARQVESAVNQLREAQAAADRSEERARRAEHAVEQVTIAGERARAMHVVACGCMIRSSLA